MKKITVEELKRKIVNEEDFQLIDVRDKFEYDEYNFGGENIPMNLILQSLDRIDSNRPVIFCCNSGKRASAIVHTLERKFQFKNLFTMKGSIKDLI